jgi:hypothetical protein
MNVNDMGRSWADEQAMRWLYRIAMVAGSALIVLLLGLAAAHSEDAAPANKAPNFVPIVVDRAQYEAVMDHLNGLPFKTALPLVKWLTELEDRAKKQWEADNAPKEVPK